MPYPNRRGGAGSGDLINRNFLLFAQDLTTQGPVATDTFHTVTFGAAQDNPKVSIAASGIITVKVAESVDYRVTVQAARAAVAGTVYLYIRVLQNGAQQFQTLLTKVSSGDDDRPEQFDFTLNHTSENEPVEVQIWRGSEGSNDGFLESVVPAIGGVNPVPSASVAVSQGVIA